MSERIRRALVSVYDKTGLAEFARALTDAGVEVLSSGGTATALEEAGVAVTRVEDVTGAPEMLGGRVKTLHPKIHGGILADRSKPEHLADLEAQGIEPIDLVVCNLYPFHTDPSVELIDIGGPTMVRAAAKNHDHVGVVTDPADFAGVAEEIRASGSLSGETRLRLARKAFAHTATYDAAIVEWLDGRSAGEGEGQFAPTLDLGFERTDLELRYGENPHQRAALYRRTGGAAPWWEAMTQHSGLPLSYLNVYDADAAWLLVHDLGDRPACAIIKHANPCGVAVADDLATAYQRAFECDERSAFGGIVAVNRPVDEETVARMEAAA
ncbi:MAG TPA: bifunctional phosphoribosylaminoimidazolecarboxamide formyltransferase/IMP cyclohydrolase, partial [Acidimicrobiia bacterium]|nr:bifunctional phosphoribosylaminoimidazolecarboxamide formyltransferase/IMP cyclohydrolase [Acidimicrobiia bacterium]